ncbi:MAG: hypothetical protein AB1582_00470 [Pseudomonadota bacterium]
MKLRHSALAPAMFGAGPQRRPPTLGLCDKQMTLRFIHWQHRAHKK